MFHRIRRILQIGLVALGLLAIALLIQHRVLFEPALTALEVWNNWDRDRETPELGQLEGRAISVVRGDVVQLRSTDRRLFNVGLTGVVLPQDDSQWAKEIEEEAAGYLADLILSSNVSVRLTFSGPKGSALGLIYSGKTNINAEMLRRGYGELKREYIAALGPTEQFRLIAAEREARNSGAGLWAHKED